MAIRLHKQVAENYQEMTSIREKSVRFDPMRYFHRYEVVN